jgi:Zn-dependent protease with chaperone function
MLPALCFAAAFVLLAVVNWISLVPWRKSVGRHWTERARILWPIRRSAAILTLYIPWILAAATLGYRETTLAGLIPSWLAGSAGAVGASWFLTREIFPHARLRPWLHDVAVGWVLRHGIWLGLIGIAVSMPESFGARTWLSLAGAFLLMVVWPSLALRLLRVVGIIRPAGERLRRIVTSRSGAGSPKVRGIWQAGGLAANALALPLTGTLLFYDRLLDVLDDEEVASIADHELGHLAESRWVIAGRYFGSMAVLPILLIRPAIAQWEFPGMLLMFVVMFVWLRLANRLAHRMELRADGAATDHQAAAGVYARALAKIYEVNQLPAVTAKSMTHPSLYERMTAAGVTPDFPRPTAPRKFTAAGWLLVLGGPLFVVWLLTGGFETSLSRRPHHRERPSAESFDE